MAQDSSFEGIDVDGSALRPEASARLDRQLLSWREKLLALDRRQRLLYFKHTKSASLEIGYPSPSALLDLVSSGEAPVRPEPEDIADVHLRAVTVTNKTTDTLKTALSRLDQTSQQSYADRGVWTLHLGLGMLRWVDPGDGAEIESPLLIVPVQLKKTGPDTPYIMFRAEDDITVNPALKLKMEEFSVSLPDVDPDAVDLAALMESVEAEVRGRVGWSVVDRAVCTSFTFHKEAIFRDLLANAESVAAHPMVQLLALGPDSPSADKFAFDPLPIDRLDTAYPPEQMYSILDADSSQRRCILAAADGQSFVMDGPPGTGKSQTIANMIAELIASGKTVLFVSEKAAALDVVRDRLRGAGLQQFLLELHSHAATRKQVVQALETTLTTRLAVRRTFNQGDGDRLVRIREELSAFAAATNEVRNPLDRSVFDVLGRLEQLADHIEASADRGASWGNLDARELANLCERASRLGALWHVGARGDDFLWRGLARQDLGSPEAREMKRSAARAREVVSVLSVRLDTIDAATGVRFERNMGDISKRVSLLTILENSHSVPAEWFSRSSLNPMRTRIVEARLAVENISERTAVLDEFAGPMWTELNEAHLQVLGDGTRDSMLDKKMLPSEIAGLLRQLTDIPPLLSSISEDAAQLAMLLGVSTSDLTVLRAQELAELAALGGVVERPEGHWLNAALQNQIAESIVAMDLMVDHARRRQEAMRDYFIPAALDHDLSGLALRFRDVHKGFGKFSAAARSDKKLLRSVSVSGKVDKTVIAQLEEAASWQQAVQALTVGEKAHGSRLGGSYQGLATDFGSLRTALENARRAATLAGIAVDPDRLNQQLARGGVPDPALILVGERLTRTIEKWSHSAYSMSKHLAQNDAYNKPLDALIEWSRMSAGRLDPVHSALGSISAVVGREVRLDDGFNMVGSARKVRIGLEDLETQGLADPSMFGEIQLGMATDFDGLVDQIDWVDSVRQCIGSPIPMAAAKKLGFVTIAPAQLDDVRKQWMKSAADLLDQFAPGRRTELEADLFADVDDAAEFLEEMERSAVPDIEDWCNFSREREWLQERGLSSVLAELSKAPRSAEAVAQSLEYAVLEMWVDETVRTDRRLADYHADSRDELVSGFKSLDQALVHDAHARVIQTCNTRIPKSLTGRAAQVIVREAQKKTRHKPVRQLLEETGSLAQELKPCFMMSPLSVSQYLPQNIKFDVVIFDEASQVLPSDAVNCVYRGRQLIVAGDQKQLPPTDFFATGGDSSGDEDDEVDVFESVLDIAKGAGGLTSLPLNWHYRSRHEDLITYSNYRFYDGKLHTFPSAVFDAPNLGVELINVNGTYRRGSSRDNPVEAAKVVERVLYFATSHPDESIGVVTFSAAQADAVMAEMDRQSSEQPVLARLLGDHDRLDGFFVKSLENVQGDERDIIVFSLGYGPDENGKFTMNFGPLNREGGWRRLNVAITRARKRVEVVSSFRASEMTSTTNEGLRHLKNYLDFAERGQKALALDLDDSHGDAESPFEEQVIDVIRGWGYDVVPQVGVAGYRIDMAVRHPDRPGAYLIGIECDGAAYHSSKTARDRDRLRENVLRNLGWELHRIWGLSWWRERDVQVTRLREAIEGAIVASERPAETIVKPIYVPSAIEIEEVDFGSRPDWATEYTVVGAPRCLTRDPKTPEGQQDLRSFVVQVIEAEAPVHQAVVYERFKDAWGVQRLGTVIKRHVDSALASANIKGQSVAPTGDGVCRLPGRQLPVVRVPDGDQPVRKLVHVPEEELDFAAANLVKDAHSLDMDTLAQQVSRLFGWQRATEEVRVLVELSVERMIRAGDLVRNEDEDLSIVFE